VSVSYEQQGHAALVTIGRPEKRGALNPAGYAALARAWRTAQAEPSVRVVVLTGTGESFCAGSDLTNFTGDAQANEDMKDAGFAVLRDVDFPKPIVAAVGGPAMGSGFEIMLAADIRLASPDAVFGLPEVKRGLFSGGGTSVRLPHQIPYAAAMEILLTGRKVSAQEALAWGFLNRIVDRAALLDAAMEIAGAIAENSPTAVQATKRSVLEGLRGNLSEAYATELRHAEHVFAGPDAREGPRAFLEKRTPVWSPVSLGATGL
jgi:enoyl-CoA hydratase